MWDNLRQIITSTSMTGEIRCEGCSKDVWPTDQTLTKRYLNYQRSDSQIYICHKCMTLVNETKHCVGIHSYQYHVLYVTDEEKFYYTNIMLIRSVEQNHK